MRSKLISIYKDKVKRKKYLKTELKSLILKSIFQNFQSNEVVRLSAFQKLSFLNKKSFISRQNNMCLISGRMGGVYRWNDISRHNMKTLAKYNMLHNTKIKS